MVQEIFCGDAFARRRGNFSTWQFRGCEDGYAFAQTGSCLKLSDVFYVEMTNERSKALRF